jgi:hypothetical protein
MSEHTPGPWRQFVVVIDGDRDEYYRCIRTESLGYRGDGGFDITGFISQADARLIAAAPDLLAACQAFVDADCQDSASLAFSMATDAIAKATEGISE